MKKVNYILIFYLIIFLTVLSSCVSVKKIEYMQENDQQDEYRYMISDREPKLIKPFDLLSIQVISVEQENSNFMQTERMGMSMMSEQAIALTSYTVDHDGNVHIPVIGAINVEGLTTYEASMKLQKSFEGYLSMPAIIVKFVNKRIVVLGEVQRPGTYYYTKEYLNVFDALSLAGDITDFGNRKNVYIIRQDNNEIIKKSLNLRDPQFVTSEDFFLQENDIIYIKPLGAKRNNMIYQPFSLVLSSISTLLVILSLL